MKKTKTAKKAVSKKKDITETTTTTQTRDCLFVIERNPKKKGERVISKEDLIKVLQEMSKPTAKNPCKYWGVLHDRDFLEDGTIKRPHYHLILRLERKALPSAIAKVLAKALGSNDINRFGYQRVSNRVGMMRYLMHLDDPQKQRYEREEVFTNDEEALTASINAVSANELNAESLIKACDEAKTHRELLRSIGLGNYIQVKGVISDIWQERQQTQKAIEDRIALINAEKFAYKSKFEAVQRMVATLQCKKDAHNLKEEDINYFLLCFAKVNAKGVDEYDE